MSVLIKGMEMPKGCWYCKFAVKTFGRSNFYCVATEKDTDSSKTERAKDCPIIEVPQHTGGKK